MKITTVFICHNEEIVNNCLNKYNDSIYILFVGSAKSIVHPRVITVRDLSDNIEHEPKLLTFTAWYAIVKNNLFADSDYLCLLEYDVILHPSFFTNMHAACKSHDIVAFAGGVGTWNLDINPRIIHEFLLVKKNVTYDSRKYWYHTTNFSMRRQILKQFVEWYYPDYLFIKDRHIAGLSWYHERLFSVFISIFNFKVIQITGLKHQQLNSHSILNQLHKNIKIRKNNNSMINVFIENKMIHTPPIINTKCKSENCPFKIHPNFKNNNKLYCCRACMNKANIHGPLCRKIIFTP